MTIQEAAALILKEESRPSKSRELAAQALQRGLVTSNSKDPIFSLATTIEKNIREDIYNRPELRFIHTLAGRLIGLPSMDKKEPKHAYKINGVKSLENTKTISLKIPVDLIEKIELATYAKVADSFDNTVNYILKKGLSAITPAIKEGVSRQLKKLDAL